MRIYLLILTVLSLEPHYSVNGANILAIFPVNSRSHHSINQPILKGLAARGHNITIISYFKLTSQLKNYNEIVLDDPYSFVDSINVNQTNDYTGLWNMLQLGKEFATDNCLKILHLEYIQRLIRSKERTVDLIFAETYYETCYTLLAHKLNVPLIGVLPARDDYGLDYMIGNPVNPSYMPFVIDSFTTNMTFLQRVSNTVQYATELLYQGIVFRKNIKPFADILSMEYPSEGMLNRRVALIFYNSHFSFVNRPMVPNAIDIAGIHIEEAKQLPKDIQDFLDGALHGAIFFSFGTTIKASSMDARKISSIVKAFSNIPQRILWRVDKLDIAQNIPPNVKLSTWFPQRDILEHKNVLAFISHCGLLGTQEAIHTATPIIGIPFIYDQFQNIQILVEKGVGIQLHYHSIDESTLQLAIKEIIDNKKYRENMSKLSRLFRDRQISPKDNAIFWTEYVIRHDGAPHLRSLGADMSWFSYLFLDMILLIVVVSLIVLYSCKLTLKLVLSPVYSDKKYS